MNDKKTCPFNGFKECPTSCMFAITIGEVVYYCKQIIDSDQLAPYDYSGELMSIADELSEIKTILKDKVSHDKV